ncbi:hypothetical protein CAOG_00227 [Capsaspora owczarzaki ATCC 30864]|uniref:DNA-directed RNA polymerase III subunit RPC3 n=1 Tax=Capsaspora owczarzaki (strain ATCC 30864) TaxID=595528 RepID=A0A0D2U086_CAPO3|nr:hypothetical protein CAOG_00227 [Capsaspora owczarzaki ATCC 30864]KJE88596.1 hypothetical protein CAOG_000227 [Capsaspora owczarzaki ATCC 30864]|eukprot:XP_004365098.2 hypothetical protein CAOG_00227 [Capsaspora owczarzaki ATCC 30864]
MATWTARGRLSCFILKSDFGPIVHRVATVLASHGSHGRLPFHRILAESELKKSEVIGVLSILLQHGLIRRDPDSREQPPSNAHRVQSSSASSSRQGGGKARAGGDGDDNEPTDAYSEHTRGRNDEAAAKEAYQVAKHGIKEGPAQPSDVRGAITMYQLDDYAILRRARFPRYLHEIETSYGRDALGRATYRTIARAAFDALTKLPDANEERLPAAVYQAFQQLAHRRFIRQIFEEEHLLAAKNRMDVDIASTSGAASRGKRAHENDDDDEDFGHSTKRILLGEGYGANANEIFWVLNTDRFHVRLRNRAIERFTEHRYGRDFADVVACVLGHAESAQSLHDHTPMPSIDYRDLQQTVARQGINHEKLKRIINILRHGDDDRATPFLLSVPDMSTISINLAVAISVMTVYELEHIVLERLGEVPAKLFRILLAKGHMELKPLTETALEHQKVMKEKMNELLTSNFVVLQEVPRGGSERAPSRTYFLWRVDLERCRVMITRDLLRMMGNLRSRQLFEMSRSGGSSTAFESTDSGERRLDDMLLLFEKYDPVVFSAPPPPPKDKKVRRK